MGCETATIGSLLEEHNLVQIAGISGTRVPADEAASLRPLVLSMQDQGGTQKTIDAAVQMVGEMLPRVNDVRRQPIPASQLILGTNCGGSDGNSGVTCNPALGVASDLLVAAGGTVVLGETTEIYGAEQLLTRRARTPRGGRQADRADRLVGVVHRSVRRHARQQSFARQQGRWPDDDLRKIARCRGQRGLDRFGRSLSICRRSDRPGPGGDGHARPRRAECHRHRGRRRAGDGLYDRPRQLFWLEADADDQSGQQHADVSSG